MTPEPAGLLPLTKEGRKAQEHIALKVLMRLGGWRSPADIEREAALGYVNTLGALERMAMNELIDKRENPEDQTATEYRAHA